MQIYSRDDAHVSLPPFAAAVRGLGFEELEGVKTEVWLGALEGVAEECAGFVLDEEQCAMGFSLGDFLEEAEEVDVGEEEARGVGCQR